MPREFSRKVRVAESIKRALAPLVSDWMRERGAGMASVTAADVSPDLKHSKIFVSVYGGMVADSVIGDLNQEAGRFRRVLGRELRLRALPELEFCLDESIERGAEMTEMLDALKPDQRD